ncbi:Chaoptin [Orchesella cincta]|uniref:Chaoptin n=1 Tax=Orchesella cincta TaxID=48709 RepID=A0A1D2MVK8_ORCCI|nr:Chaoptin [Orchesella cincta]
MEPEWMVMRVAYFVLFITLSLMAWAYMVQASIQAEPLVAEPLLSKGHQGNVLDKYPPCSFNPLCQCSKPGPSEFGIVACHYVNFGNLPIMLNSSRAFLLSMVGNNMQVLDAKRLVGSGLWRLEIKENELNYVADDAFVGLSKFLAELDLQCNQLTSIPTSSLRRLAKPAKLKILELGYNKITDVYPDDLAGLPTSITRLGLSGNMITYIQENAFASLPRLESLDLSDNSIQFIHNQAFASLSKSLKLLYLDNNLFLKIPFQALSPLELKTLDLSHNLLTSMFDIFYEKKITVGVLKLNYNRITSVPPYAFQNFRKASVVSLAFNPIESLVDDAFKDASIDLLDLSHCFIREVQPKAFRGLENSLESLDISFNNITHIPFELFENFDRLRHLNLDQNRLQITLDELENFRLFTLYRFSIIGDMMSPFSMEDIELMRNLRSLNISNFGMASLNPQVFEGFGLAVEDIKISQGKLSTIKAGAFSSLTGLKSIDLSENRIERIENQAFEGVEHSLLRLKMANSIRMGTLPSKAFQKLSALRYLDLSANGLNNVPEDTFAESKRLQYLNLRFNKLSSVPKNMFDCTKVPRIQTILLSFNNIKEVRSGFVRLKELEIVELNENVIETISPRAFEDLTNLRILNLAGNKISILEDEAFQNLPRLQILDLSHNRLSSINWEAFEQLGTLSSFRISLSHNNIQRLLISTEDSQIQDTDISGEDGSKEDDPIPVPVLSSISSSSIESIDLSYNNISFISPHFFFPISSTLIELDLSHNNRLQNITLENLSGMRFIQSIQLNHNSLDTLEYNSFRESKYIQIINMDHNMLRDIPPDLFEGCVNLRVLSATDNKIRALTDSIFKDTQLEILNVSNNQLVRFPENALARVATTLVQLDLSGNEISSLTASQVECLQKLRWLDLSNNRIVVVAENSFDNLYSLLHLDLSGNSLGKLSARFFEGIKETLLHLHIANMSLDALPEFDTFAKLLTFNSSYNRLTYLPTNFGVNVSSLRTLDISGNQIPAPPNTIWHTIPRLSQVFMQDNPIRSLTNDSFLQLERLHELDITDLPLESAQVGVFTPLVCMKKISFGPFSSSISPGLIIQAVESLQSLYLKLDVPMMSVELTSYPLPEKISTITVSGEELLSISGGAFDEVEGRQLKLIIDNTGITDLPNDVLHHLGDATQLSLKITGNNSALKTISNPNSQYRKEPYVTYLETLELDESMTLSCSCETGWIEFWLRQWMEKTCPIGSSTPKDESKRCNKMLQMLRNINCHNKPGTDLMHAFITDLECGWESSAPALCSHFNNLRSALVASLFSILLVPIWALRV